MLAVLFACEKLHTYIHGQKVMIHTDHKPLQSIFSKPISLAPPRLQRMLLRLRMYELDVKYVGANSVKPLQSIFSKPISLAPPRLLSRYFILADTLSRLIKPNKDKIIPDLDVTIAQILNIRPTRLQTMQAETKVDRSLTNLIECINNGWPKNMYDVPLDIQPYWCFRDELALLDGLVMKGSRVVIPKSLIADTLSRLHDGHQGMTATLQRALRTVFWPKMQQDIEELILKCNDCQIHGRKKPKSSENQISATRPMEVLGVDLMNYSGGHHLVTIDYFSGYIFTDQVTSETAEAIIDVMLKNFMKLGLAEAVMSDNGPCFKSEKFKQLCSSLGIEHITSSPHYHQSNGRVERAIQTLKQIIKKCKSQTEVTMALLAYHGTPTCEGVPSPAELFFNRRINTRLGMMQSTQLTHVQKQKLSDKRTAHINPPSNKDLFVVGQSVWFTEDSSVEWKPGTIESIDPMPDSFWVVNINNRRRLRRNIHNIKPRISAITHGVPSLQLAPSSSTSQPQYDYIPRRTELYNADNNIPLDDDHQSRNNDTPDESIPPQSPTAATPSKPSQPRLPVVITPSKPPILTNRDEVHPPVTTRTGRKIKSTRDENYVYKCNDCGNNKRD